MSLCEVNLPWMWLKLWCSRSRWTRWDLLRFVVAGCWGCPPTHEAGKHLPHFPLRCLWWLGQTTKPRTPNPRLSPQTRCIGPDWKTGSIPGRPCPRPSLKVKKKKKGYTICTANMSNTQTHIEKSHGQHLGPYFYWGCLQWVHLSKESLNVI